MTAKEFLYKNKEYLKIKQTIDISFVDNIDIDISKLDYLKQRDKIIHKDILEKIDKLQKEQISKL